MRVVRRFWVVLAVFAMLAVACADDDDTEASTEASGGDDPADAPADTADPEAEEEPEPAPGDDEAEPEELTSSFRGVTETSIKVGIAVPDFDALQAAGIANYQGDADVAFQAFIDVINAEGGVYGRQIEPVYVSYDFLDPVTQDTACQEFVGDHEVFIVLYGLLTENNLCLSELNDTMVMTRSFQTTNLRERSGDTLWLQLNAVDDERARVLGTVVAESGRLDGKTVGILAAQSQDGGLEGDVLQQTLTDLGYESTLLLTTADQNDATARNAEFAVLAERFQTEGVDFLFDLRGGGDTAGQFAQAGFTPELAFKALGASVDGASDRSVLDGAIGVGERSEQAMFDDPEFQSACMDVVRDANPELTDEMAVLPTGDEQAAGARSWLNPVMIACDQTMLLDLIGEIAGADLTNESFLEALDELGPVRLNGYGQASFRSADKWDGLDEFSIQEYDFATDTVNEIGDSIIVER